MKAQRVTAPRVLVVLDTAEGWSRGILLGFAAAAHERGWELLHYNPSADLDWLASEWAPAVAVLGPKSPGAVLARLASGPVISVNADRSAEGIPSVCLDEERIAKLALSHLVSRGLEHVTTFRFDAAPFAVVRERAFRQAARSAGARVAPTWLADGSGVATSEDRRTLVGWLRSLPKPCGIFTCCDAWGRVVARYARAAGLRVPEDLALVGVDNDTVECELITPPLSSVAVPWRALGQEAASLAQRLLAGKPVSVKRPVVVAPVDVVARRSTDTLAIDDALVAEAVAWIHAHAASRVTVPLVARGVGSSRQRLERRFRASLGRTVQEEVRRVRVESAKRILRTTTIPLAAVAKQSGFTTAALLSVAFQRELGMPPGVYRRRMLQGSTRTEEP